MREISKEDRMKKFLKEPKNGWIKCTTHFNRIICVNTGDKFSDWYVDNLKYMIDVWQD